MAVKRFVLLVTFLSKCLGYTEFIYTVNKEVNMFCKTNKWQISTESDNTITVNCSMECEHGETFNSVQNSCPNKTSHRVGDKCTLITRSGFFRCVTALDSGFLFPFKPSPNTITSYIVAIANEEMTTKPGERSSVELSEGGDVFLNCSFNFTEGYKNQAFIVIWIKTNEKSSSCVYSFDFSTESMTYNHHCSVQKELFSRLSNHTEQTNTHNIRISNTTESDAGQYLCALQVPTYKYKIKVNWKIINNITVSFPTAKRPEIKTDGNDGSRFDLIPVYVTVALLLGLAVVGFIWKRTKISKRKNCEGSQSTQLQRKPNWGEKEETADMYCSPYAVGRREEEMNFKSSQDALKQEDQEEPTDPYSVVKMNDLYESGA